MNNQGNATNRLAKNCLLVDDDDDDREIFCLALAQADPSMKCSVARDGVEALAMLTSASDIPNYIFLDLNMPRMNGKECLREIRKTDRLKDVPVIIFSTSLLQKDIMETQTLGASSFITKPPSVDMLAQSLAGLFNKPPV
jgi:CheY-like chemotaxis protein